MSGYVIPLAPKRTFDFTTLPQSFTEEVVLADRVSLVHWQEMVLLVDVHDFSLANGSVTVNMYAQSWTAEDPGLTFLGANVASINISSGTPNPAFLTAPASLFTMSAMARFTVAGTRSAVGGNLFATISAKLSVKDGN